MELSDKEFEEIVSQAIDRIPEKYFKKLDNVAFIIEDEPSPELRNRMKLKPYQTLLGLYEGAPLPQRMGQTKVLPDKITLFKLPLLNLSPTKDILRDKVARTIWHEVAHYYGLDHGMIDKLD